MKTFEELETLAQSKLDEIKRIEDELFKNVIEYIFDNFPKLVEIKLRGYTPAFNDGEPCEFRLAYNYIDTEFVTDENPLSRDEIYSITQKISKCLKLLPQEFFTSRFDTNGFELTITKDNVTVGEYDCGY